MGRGHAASGMAAGAAGVAWGLPALGYVVPGGVWSVALLGTILAGWTLAPDIDSPLATATHAFGPVSRALHGIVCWIGPRVIKATGTHRDQPREHRGMTHSVPMATVLFAVLLAAGERWPRIVIALVFAIAVGMLVKLGTKPHVSASVGAGSGVLLWLVSAHVAGPGAVLVATAAALGCALHIWGDWITRQGVPALAPLVKVKGKRWWNFRPPLALTFKAGGRTENVYVTGFWLITALAAIDTADIFW